MLKAPFVMVSPGSTVILLFRLDDHYNGTDLLMTDDAAMRTRILQKTMENPENDPLGVG
jgi:hypothetical protein